MVKKTRAAGYTLIEVMITVALLSVFTTLGAQMWRQVNNFFIQVQSRKSIEEDARAIMYLLTRELHEAHYNSIVIDRLNSSQPFYSRITFTKVEGTTVSVWQNGSTLIHLEGNTQTTLTKNLFYLAFTFPRSDNMGILSVAMTLQKASYNGQVKDLHMASQQVQIMNQ